MALVNGGFLHYVDMKKKFMMKKKFIKNLLLRNHWSDFVWGLISENKHEQIPKKSTL